AEYDERIANRRAWEGCCRPSPEDSSFLSRADVTLLLAEAFPPTRELQNRKAMRRRNLALHRLIGMFERNELPPQAGFRIELLIEANAGKVPRLKTGRPRDPAHNIRRALVFAKIQEELAARKPSPRTLQKTLREIGQNLQIPFNGRVIRSLSYPEVRE